MSTSIIPRPIPEWQVFTFGNLEIHGKLDDDGEPIFIASEVCAACGLTNVSEALKALDLDEKREITKPDLIGRRQGIRVVTESGLYHLIFKSRTDEAVAFRRKVTEEILPAIRKTGAYIAKPMSMLEYLAAHAQAMLALEQKVDRGLAGAAQNIENIQAQLLDADYFTVLQFCQRQGIHVEPSVRSKWGTEAKALSRARGIEVKSVVEGRYSVGRYHKSILLEVCVVKHKPPPGQLSLI